MTKNQGQQAQFVDTKKRRIYKQKEFFLETNLTQSLQLSPMLAQIQNILFSIDIFIQ